MSELSGREFLLAQLAPSDLLGICLGLIGAALVLGGAYYATILINKDPRDIEPCQKLTATFPPLSGLLLSLAGLSGAVWDELTKTQSHTSGDNASGSGSN
ncbi:MAG TPA: hypothetical protein VKD68_03830 [Methyloceanibacter sp.]|nr:hypothetical protein [Methyloceanibacter sp.]